MLRVALPEHRVTIAGSIIFHYIAVKSIVNWKHLIIELEYFVNFGS